MQYHLHFEYCSQMQFPHPQFLIDSQLTNMSSQEVTVQKISCPPKSSEDWIINKHQFCNYCKFDSRYVEKMHNNCASFYSTSTFEEYTHNTHVSSQIHPSTLEDPYSSIATPNQQTTLNLSNNINVPPQLTHQVINIVKFEIN